MSSKLKQLFATFWLSLLLTIIIAGALAYYGGVSYFSVFLILVAIEITFSFDNAVVNSQVLKRLSHFWQTIFLSVGIIIAVFVVRFLLPIVIVALATDSGLGHVVDLAIYSPDDYAHLVAESSPAINAFGGIFLLLVGFSFFISRDKTEHWLRGIEHGFAALARLRGAAIVIVAIVLLITALVLPAGVATEVLFAGLIGLGLYILLTSFNGYFEKRQNKAVAQTGIAAFVSFIYLEALDASFSLDGVVGALAITSNIVLVVAGLGVGAIWVRSLTIHLLRSGTLSDYRYLVHGAHYAILVLGAIMIAKLYDVEPPDWLTGTIGIMFIVAAVISSIIIERRIGQTTFELSEKAE